MKTYLVLFLAILAAVAFGTVTVVEDADAAKEAAVATVEPNQPAAPPKPTVISLEKPDLTKGMALMRAMKNRKTDREFSDKDLSKQQLSEILWVANGVNRDDGKRTVPSAMNRHPMDVYAVLAEGIYLYDPAKHELICVAEGDYREYTGGQPFVKNAPLNLVFVADMSKFTDSRRPGWEISNDLKMQWAAIETGCQVQNVYLYCASERLATVIRGMVDKDKLAPLMKLKAEQVIICAQTVGLPK